jgi:hypothetical protein
MAALSRKKKMWRKVKGSGITDEYRKLDKERRFGMQREVLKRSWQMEMAAAGSFLHM